MNKEETVNIRLSNVSTIQMPMSQYKRIKKLAQKEAVTVREYILKRGSYK